MSARPFELRTTDLGPDDLLVGRLRGEERLSRPYAFDLQVHSTNAELEGALLGEHATLTLHAANGLARSFHGVLAKVCAEAVVPGQTRAVYTVRLVPRLWLASLGKDSRIFQELSVPEIVDLVLAPHGVTTRWKLARTYPKRDYCVQHHESDLAFVTRLLAEEGLFYFLDGVDGEDKVVVCDLAAHYEPILGARAVPFRDPSEGASAEHVESLVFARSMSAQSLVRTAFDFRRPHLSLSTEASTKKVAPGRRVIRHDEDWDAWRMSDESVAVELEAERGRAHAGQGRSTLVRAAPGHTFVLTDHPLAGLNRAYAFTRVRHQGWQPEVVGDSASPGRGTAPTYDNRFACVPDDVALRPRRGKKPSRQFLETATVVGPDDEEIHTDELGRVKVQFHWDRDGKRDDKASCWVRPTHPWAGSSWGFQFIPRVGMEVLVGFLDGDPDRPMILGAAFNGTHPTPYALPAHKTVSGLRTRSTPKSEGYNELRFEDAAGKEQVYLRAERNLDEYVGRDCSRQVRNDERVSVGNDRSLTVHGDNVRVVEGNEVITIEKNLIMHIVGRQHIVVGGKDEDGGSIASPQAPPVIDAGAAIAEGAVSPAKRLLEEKAALVSFLVEELPDEAYEEGALYRGRAQALSEGLQSLGSDVSTLKADYAKLLGEARDGVLEGAPLTRAGELRRQAELATIAAKEVGKTLASERARLAELAQSAEEGRQSFEALDRAYGEQLAIAEGEAKRVERDAALVSQMAGTVVESAGQVVPTPATGKGRGGGGGGGDNAFSVEGGVSKMTIKGGGEIDAPDGLKIKCAGSSIEITSAGITIDAPIVSVVGHPIKLNC